MKTKIIKNRLALNKETIVSLSKTEISEAHGGMDNKTALSFLGYTVCGLRCWPVTQDPNFCRTDTI
jgi:hypothetical protein